MTKGEKKKMPKLLELFAGTRSISKVFERHGWQTYTIEQDRRHKNISRYDDILNVTAEEILRDFGRPSVIWLSPPCTSYSIAAISTHRRREEDGNLAPKSDLAAISDQLIIHCLKLIEQLRPRIWFIENPRGGLRKCSFMKGLPRYTVTYCTFGVSRMKPTDIWSNIDPEFPPMCRNGNTDCHHEPAPRGSKTGTQGLKDSVERSIIPEKLCEHIFNVCQKGEKKEMNIELENVKPSNHSTIKGNFDVLFPEIKLKIKECRLVLNRSGEYFIGFPSHKDTNGSWKNDIFMEDKDNPLYKEILDKAVLGMLEAQRTTA